MASSLTSTFFRSTSHTWSIDDFARLARNAEPDFQIRSDPFELTWEAAGGVADGVSLWMALTFKGPDADRVGLSLTASKAARLSAAFFISTSQGGRQEICKTGNGETVKVASMASWSNPEALNLDILKQPDLVSNGKLTLVCDIVVFCPCPQSSNTTINKKPDLAGDSGPTADFSKFWESGLLSDVTIICGDREFPCHRLVLASHSEVFAAMFANAETAESQQGKVRIVDASADDVKAMIEFLYTGKHQNLADAASQLLVLADKYDMARLKAECQRELMLRLSQQNALDRLVEAHLVKADELFAAAAGIVRKNLVAAIASPSWQLIETKFPEILTRMLSLPEPGPKRYGKCKQCAYSYGQCSHCYKSGCFSDIVCWN